MILLIIIVLAALVVLVAACVKVSARWSRWEENHDD